MRRPREHSQNSTDRAPKKLDAGHGAGGSRIGPNTRCFVCGRAGHVARDCRRRSSTCHTCGQEGHMSWNCPRRGQQHNEQQGGMPGRDIVAPTSFTCGATGHIAPQCPNRNQQGGAGRGRGTGPVAAAGSEPPTAGRGAPSNG